MPRLIPTALLALALLGSFALALPSRPSAEEPVSYPDGYRAWRHVKSMVILPGHALADPFAGIHHVYANQRALEGLDSGAYEDGAVFVFDLLEAQPAENAIAEGPRKLIGVMQRDAKRYAATGGWGFEGFGAGDPKQRLVADGGASCFACHQQAQVTAFVFTRPRD